MLKGHAYLIWQTLPYLAMKDSRKSPSPMLCQWGYRDIVQVLAISSAQVPAGRRINFGGLAFASKAILRQNTSDPAICRLCLSFPLNNSKILGKTLIIPLRKLNGNVLQHLHAITTLNIPALRLTSPIFAAVTVLTDRSGPL